jgi:uncharacterized protein YndB with AHSA1/START domain
MAETLQDTIERAITVKASKERVYGAITDPKQLISWFPDKVEGDLKVGEQSTFTFDGNGDVSVYVVDAKPYEYFAYRWIPGADADSVTEDVLAKPNTLVEFHIEEVEGGTKVTLKESGFASLSAEVAEAKFKDNSGGWEYMMASLEKLFAEK